MLRLTNSCIVAFGAFVAVGSISASARAQTVTIDAFVSLNGRNVPTICLIAKVPPKDLCGDILQGVSFAQVEAAREALERKIEQQSRPLMQMNK